MEINKLIDSDFALSPYSFKDFYTNLQLEKTDRKMEVQSRAFREPIPSVRGMILEDRFITISGHALNAYSEIKPEDYAMFGPKTTKRAEMISNAVKHFQQNFNTDSCEFKVTAKTRKVIYSLRRLRTGYCSTITTNGREIVIINAVADALEAFIKRQERRETDSKISAWLQKSKQVSDALLAEFMAARHYGS